MTKQKITISLDSEIAKTLRLQSIEKYGDSRSMSRLIEDLATGAAEAKKPEACSTLGHRSEYSFKAEAEFKEAVKKITAQLPSFKFLMGLDGHGNMEADGVYFTLKEACELEINKYAGYVNECWGCKGLNGPVPMYPDAGKNFEIYATMKSDLR